MLEVVDWEEKAKEMETTLEELIAFKKRSNSYTESRKKGI